MTQRRSFVPVFRCSVLLVASSLLWTRAAGRQSQNPAPPPPQAQDISPPVTVEVVQQPTNDPMVAVATVTVTARAPVTGVTLTVRTPPEVKTDSAQRPLNLALGRPVTVQIRLQASAPGQHRIQFDIKAAARGYETAGTAERRYLVVDGRNPARILTGRALRRERRAGVADSLREQMRRDPKGDATLDQYLAGKTKPLPAGTAVPEDTAKVPLAPPAGGIEPYDQVVDKTRQVQRELDPITVTGRLLYRDRSNNLRSLVNATIDIRDSDFGPDEQVATTITDWNGHFSATVDNDDGWFQDGRDIFVRIRATNSRFRAQDCSYWPDWTYAWETETHSNLNDGTVLDFGTRELVDYGEAAILFQDINQGWNYLTTTGGHDPGFVDLCYPEDASQYSTFWEEVDIEDGDEVARDIVLHEYGHATMHNAYDGYWPSNTGGSHTFDDVIHQNFAFTEGWGTFIALAINDDGVYNSNGWSRSIEGFNHATGHTAGDGPRNEGHVAAGMNDVRDATSDGNCATGSCDPSGSNRAPMATIWRDAFWGSKSDNINEYWPRLCRELDDQERDAAIKSLAFNDINVATCVCTVKYAMAGSPDADMVVTELRTLRDFGLRGTAFGGRITDLFYRHTGEVATLMMRDAELRRSGVVLFRQAAKASRALSSNARDTVLLDAKSAELARAFIVRAQAMGSAQLRADFETLKPLIDGFEGVRAEDVRLKLGGGRLPK